MNAERLPAEKLADAIGKATGETRELALERAARILHELEERGLTDKARDAVRAVSKVWPGAVIWDVRDLSATDAIGSAKSPNAVTEADQMKRGGW